MHALAARKYPNPRKGPLVDAQAETRRLAYAIKTIASPTADFETAGREMALLISGPCWLVPVPSSTGTTDANAMLASHIARHCEGAQVVKALRRTQPIESQCVRHKANLGPIPIEDHHIARTGKNLGLRQTYLVDNVTTSGNTLAAARKALGLGIGLVFANAADYRPPVQPSLL